MDGDTIQSLEDISPYYITPDLLEKIKASNDLEVTAANNLLSFLNKSRDDINNKITTIESEHPECSEAIKFDIGVKEAFLETEQVDETNQFYELNNPCSQTLLVAKILVGMLNKWDLFGDSNPWENIQKYFKEEMGTEISIY